MTQNKGYDFESLINNLYDTWKDIRNDTIKNLGKETAFHIIDFHGNNWIDIMSWINSNYTREEQLNIVFFQYFRLFKEIYWLQFLFLNANYPMMYRNLRYMLEMMAQAYYIDNEYFGLPLCEQMEKIMIKEEKIYGWNLVKKVLGIVFNMDENRVNEIFHPTWVFLNKHVHSSAKQMNMIVTEDIDSLITDSFNLNLSNYVLEEVDEILDIIDVLMIDKFPKIKKNAKSYKFFNEWNQYLPYTSKIILD